MREEGEKLFVYVGVGGGGDCQPMVSEQTQSPRGASDMGRGEKRWLRKKIKTHLVPWHVLHGQITAIAHTAKSHTLDLDKVRLSPANKIRVALCLNNRVHVPRLDQCHPKHSALHQIFLAERINRGEEALPKVRKQRAINSLESVPRGRINTHI